MANSIPKKRAKAEQLHKKRAQAASALVTGAKKSPKVCSERFLETKANKPEARSSGQALSVGRAKAMPAQLPPAHYPIKRVAIGKRQVFGGGA